MATPIGNLSDVTLRGLDALKSVDAIAAEDTRVTRRLLEHYGIPARPIAVHAHNEVESAAHLIGLLKAGKSIALVSDAGTPAVSDPGARLVRRVREAGFAVVPIPGPSALTAAVSAAGLAAQDFLFCGFLPAQKTARRHALERLRPLSCALVFYEAPHRVRETLTDLALTLGAQRELVIARELTKLHEAIHACRLGEALAWLDQDPNREKGEFVLLLDGVVAQQPVQDEQGDKVLSILLRELPLKQAVQLAAQITGARRNALYARALELRRD